jgi:hypothetical protein
MRVKRTTGKESLAPLNERGAGYWEDQAWDRGKPMTYRVCISALRDWPGRHSSCRFCALRPEMIQRVFGKPSLPFPAQGERL